MTITAKVDASSALTGLDRLLGDFRVSLARSMAVAGGQVIRNEAILRAPVGTEEGGSIYPGALKASIYLAYSPERSTGSQQNYRISWNSKKAPHGHLIEFGHWQPYKVAKIPGGYGGGWYTTPQRRSAPKWTAAHPFLRPAYEASGQRAIEAMQDRAAERFPELLAEAGVF